MHISNVEYISKDGRPLLKLDIDGRTVILNAEPKATTFAAGYIYISGWEDKVPPVTIAGKEYSGLVSDPELFRIYARFGYAVNQGTFKEGAIAL